MEVLLGLLSVAPMSGYDLGQAIRASVGFFWNESYGQIYPNLKRLAAEGFVTAKTERQKGKPDRRVYSITKKGRERLAAWLAVAPQPEIPRNELLLKLFFGAQVPRRLRFNTWSAWWRARADFFASSGGSSRKRSKDSSIPMRLIGRWRRASGSWSWRRTCAGAKRHWPSCARSQSGSHSRKSERRSIMQANNIRQVENSGRVKAPAQIASWAHLAGFLAIGAGVVALGFLAQHAPGGGGGAAPGQLASHARPFRFT